MLSEPYWTIPFAYFCVTILNNNGLPSPDVVVTPENAPVVVAVTVNPAKKLSLSTGCPSGPISFPSPVLEKPDIANKTLRYVPAGYPDKTKFPLDQTTVFTLAVIALYCPFE